MSRWEEAWKPQGVPDNFYEFALSTDGERRSWWIVLSVTTTP